MGSRLTSRIGPLLAAAVLLSLTTSAAAVSRCPGDCDGDDVVAVDELIAGVRAALAPGTGRACDAADTDGDGTITVSELVGAVAAALDGCPFERVPFTATAADGALELTPATALRGDAVYAVVLTSAVRAAGGATLRPSSDFAAARGVPATEGAGPVALYSDDPNADANPYPDGRLVAGAGVTIPDRIALRGLADSAKLAQARGVLRDTADAVGAAGAFSTTAPIRIALSAPVDLATVDADSVLLIRRPDRALALAPLLDALEHAGTPRAGGGAGGLVPDPAHRGRSAGGAAAARRARPRRCARPSSIPIPPTTCRSASSPAAPARTPTSSPPTRPSRPWPAASTRRPTSAPPTACSIAPC